ncbi:MAG: FHA domain-containing protein [Chloroflexota bacterium]
MILCPNCLHKEMVGAMFCSECGAQLIFPTGVPTGVIRPTTAGLQPPPGPSGAPAPAPAPAAALDSTISLNIISTGEMLIVDGGKETTLGRVSEGQPVVPDLDLTPYKAYEAGVSRMHASLRTIEDQVMVTDLGSANGTRINGRQISAHIPYPIRHGDILTLGKFKIQVLLRTR